MRIDPVVALDPNFWIADEPLSTVRAMQLSPVVVAGTASNTVDKQTWRSGESRELHNATMDPMTITREIVDQVSGLAKGFAIVADDAVRMVQRQARWNQFTFTAVDDVIAIRFHRGGKTRQHLELGPLVRGKSIEMAINQRTAAGGHTGRMLYIDEIWRFWWPALLEAGTTYWPTPDRVIDLRKVLH